MLYYIRRKLLEILKLAYPEKYETYKKVFIDLEFKEKKSNHYRYIFTDRKIIVNTLSRKPSYILIDFLQGLAAHIDIINRKETHSDREYFMVLKKLIDTSINYNFITLQDLIKNSNQKLNQNLQKNFGSYSSWVVKEKSVITSIDIWVFDAFMIRNILKVNDYFYDFDQLAWTKSLKVEDTEEEQFFTEMYKDQADFMIVSDNSFYIKPSYLLKLETYSIEDSPLLKALSYIYDGEQNKWSKSIYASELKVELESIQEIPKQNIAILRNKSNR